jgi:hypothetical protein
VAIDDGYVPECQASFEDNVHNVVTHPGLGLRCEPCSPSGGKFAEFLRHVRMASRCPSNDLSFSGELAPERSEEA